jgi:GNAT superfamily N-acetyltransferase
MDDPTIKRLTKKLYRLRMSPVIGARELFVPYVKNKTEINARAVRNSETQIRSIRKNIDRITGDIFTEWKATGKLDMTHLKPMQKVCTNVVAMVGVPVGHKSSVKWAGPNDFLRSGKIKNVGYRVSPKYRGFVKYIDKFLSASPVLVRGRTGLALGSVAAANVAAYQWAKGKKNRRLRRRGLLGTSIRRTVYVDPYTRRDGTRVSGYEKDAAEIEVRVRGYTRRDGTRVRGYTRTEESEGEYAPGLPEKGRMREIPSLTEGSGKIWEYGVQYHRATTNHYDLRLGDRDDGVAFSWALPRANMPKPGEMLLAVRQSDHTVDYMDFKGRISEGYGKGTVAPIDRGRTEIVSASPTVLKFNVYGGRENNEYILRHWRGNNWLLQNVTPRREKRTELPSSKPRYKDQPIEKVDVTAKDEVVQAKIDGSHVTVSFTPGKQTRVFSHRPTQRETGVIDHTQRVPGVLGHRGSKETGKTVIRAEVYAVDSKGQPLPASRIGGLLNAGVWKSREKQQAEGHLRMAGFDVVTHRGKNVENSPYNEKLEILRTLADREEIFHLPDTATTPAQKRKLLADIKSGKHPQTREGVVVWKADVGARPIKAKLKDDHDIYVREIFPAHSKSGKKLDRAGGFSFSWTPDGPIVGRVGTGFNHAMLRDMSANPDKYIGRVATVSSMERLPSGALRHPSFDMWHLDKDLERVASAKMGSSLRLAEKIAGSGALKSLRRAVERISMEISKRENVPFEEVFRHMMEPGVRHVPGKYIGSIPVGNPAGGLRAVDPKNPIFVSVGGWFNRPIHSKAITEIMQGAPPRRGVATSNPRVLLERRGETWVPPTGQVIRLSNVRRMEGKFSVDPYALASPHMPATGAALTFRGKVPREIVEDVTSSTPIATKLEEAFSLPSAAKRYRDVGPPETSILGRGDMESIRQELIEGATSNRPGRLPQDLLAKIFDKTSAEIQVSSYTRSDGTRVRSHVRGGDGDSSTWKHGKTAVIIKGNPDARVERGKELADAFYAELKATLESEGFHVSFDPGLPHTSPKKADVWLGHSRGVDRLRFAPKGTITIAVGSGIEDAINHPEDAAHIEETKRTILKGGKSWADIPVKDRPQVPAGHVQLTAKMKKEIRSRVSESPIDPSKIPDFMYFGSRKKLDKLSGEALFLTPHKGIASIFIADHLANEKGFKDYSSHYTEYPAWNADDSELQNPLETVEIRHNIEGVSGEGEVSGYIYKVDVRGIKDKLRRYKGSDESREVVYSGEDLKFVSRTPHKIQWKARYDKGVRERKGLPVRRNQEEIVRVKFPDVIPSKMLARGDKDPEISGFVYPKEDRQRAGIYRGNKLVGFMTPRLNRHRAWRVGAIYIQPDSQRLGVGSEAIRSFLENRRAAILPIGVDNIASQKAFSNAGFTLQNPSEVLTDADDGWKYQLWHRDEGVRERKGSPVRRGPNESRLFKQSSEWTAKRIHKLADRLGVVWDADPKFMKFSRDTVGVGYIDKMTPAQRGTLAKALMKRVQAGGKDLNMRSRKQASVMGRISSIMTKHKGPLIRRYV